MYENFGLFGSAEEINMTASALREEGDMENLSVLAKENGLTVSLQFAEGTEDLCNSFTAAVGRLQVEMETIKEFEKDIPAEPIVEYLMSRCDDEDLAKAIRSKDKSLKDCMEHVRKEAKKLVSRKQPYLADQVVYNMALEYYEG